MSSDELTRTIVDFLTLIGIETAQRPLSDETFLPGIQIEHGRIVFDVTKLRHPGDLLHEAGHLAVVPAVRRSKMSDKIEAADVNANVVEAAAMLWSYAAARHIGIDPQIVFHSNGYNGKAAALLAGFDMGVYIGLPLLAEAGMATSGAPEEAGGRTFPKMVKWLCD